MQHEDVCYMTVVNCRWPWALSPSSVRVTVVGIFLCMDNTCGTIVMGLTMEASSAQIFFSSMPRKLLLVFIWCFIYILSASSYEPFMFALNLVWLFWSWQGPANCISSQHSPGNCIDILSSCTLLLFQCKLS